MLLASCHAFQVQTVSRANPVVRAADGGGLPSGIGLVSLGLGPTRVARAASGPVVEARV